MRPPVGSTDFLMRVCWDDQGHSLNDPEQHHLCCWGAVVVFLLTWHKEINNTWRTQAKEVGVNTRHDRRFIVFCMPWGRILILAAQLRRGNYRLPYSLVALTFLKWHNYQLPSLGSHENKEHQDSDLLDTIGNSFLVTQVICRKFISIFVFRVSFLLLLSCGKDKRKIHEANWTPRGQASSVILGRTEALLDRKEAKWKRECFKK